MENITSIDKALCTGCGACYNKCPLNAITIEPDENGFFRPVVNEAECVSCGICYNTCPEIKSVKETNKSQALAIWAKNESNGDTVLSILAESILNKSGIVFGARYSDDWLWVFHEGKEDLQELKQISTVKSVHSDTRRTFKEAKEKLDNGRAVLYSGTPCQIAGLYSFLGKDYDNLYTVEFACSGHSSVKAYQSFIKEYTNNKELGEVDLNKNGQIATMVRFKDGTEKKSPVTDSRWYEGENGIIKGARCYTCQYTGALRVADITIGQAMNLDKDPSKKATTVLVNTRKGRALLDEAGDKLFSKDILIEDAKLPEPGKKSPDRSFFFSHLDSKGYHKALWYGKGMRFDTGIVGWWFASNYGSSLTYYALAKILEGTGRKPIFIHVPKLDGTPWDKDAQQTIDFIGKRFRIANYRDMAHIHEVNSFCDSFMLGSDQMWTPLATHLVGYTFFLDFADLDKKKIAFSTSFGQDKFEADEKICQTAGDFLRRFDAISVREYTGVDICKNKFGVDAEQIIDPVFLCTKEDYDQLIKDIKIKLPKKYLLSYILDPSPEKEEAVKAIAKKEGLEVLSVLSMRDYDKNASNWHVGKNMPKPSTEEFLYYIKNCSYLVTDSHHGACMGIIYERPYVAITNASRGVTRFETVAKAFGLESRVIYSPSEALTNEKIHAQIDYNSVNENIEREKRRALDWLEMAFNKETVVATETVNTMEAKLNALQRSLANTINNYEHRLKGSKEAPKAPVVSKELSDSFDFIKIRIIATLLRDYGIKHVVLSPGGRDVPIIRMFEHNEKEFVLHRVTDERSAGYYGLGLASLLGKPVACICTSGTAASNYLPAVTEAYFTGVPLVMITADRIGVYHGQGEDQTIPQKDIYRDVVKMAVSLPDNGGGATEHQIKRDISTCILEATHNGNGPVHINVPIQDIGIGANSPREQWALLPTIQPHILRAGFVDGDKEMHKWADVLKKSPRVLVVYGQNRPLSKEEKADVERFAAKYNCVIVTDSISNYSSEYSVNPFNMLSKISQDDFNKHLKPDILITVGGKRLMNDPLTFKVRAANGVRHWSVTPDGSVKDFYFKLTSVIESTQAQFFKWFADNAGASKNDKKYLNEWKTLVEKHPIKPAEDFNSFYIQDKFFPAIPKGSFLHLGVGQSFFFVRRHDIDPSVEVYCNMGTNGIDGCASTFMGQCAVEKSKLCFLIVGDLAFFYDMNSIWNKNLTKNMRILLVNNNGSGLLRNHNLKAVTSVHNTSAEGWVRSTGFEYMCAHSKAEYEEKLKYFMSDKGNKALFFEVFCD